MVIGIKTVATMYWKSVINFTYAVSSPHVIPTWVILYSDLGNEKKMNFSIYCKNYSCLKTQMGLLVLPHNEKYQETKWPKPKILSKCMQTFFSETLKIDFTL